MWYDKHKLKALHPSTSDIKSDFRRLLFVSSSAVMKAIKFWPEFSIKGISYWQLSTDHTGSYFTSKVELKRKTGCETSSMWFFCVGDRRNKALVTRERLVVIITNMKSANSITWCVCVVFLFVCFFLYCCLFIGFNFSFLFSSFWLEKKKKHFWGKNPIKDWRLFLDYPKFSRFQALGWNRVYWHSCAPCIITEELTIITNQVINRGTWISKKKTQKSLITFIYKLKIAYSFNWKEVIK